MKRNNPIKIGIILAIAVMTACVSLVRCEADTVPLMFNYQGQLKDAAGSPVAAGNIAVSFRIYDAKAGGHLIWGRSQNVVVDDEGYFNALIGEGGSELTMDNPAPKVSNIIDAFKGETRGSRWLEIQVDGAKPFSQRQQLLSVPYAFLTANAAQSAGDFDAGSTLTVASNTAVSGSVTVDSYAEFDVPVTFQGAASISNALLSDVPVDFNGKTDIQGETVMAHNLSIQGDATFSGPVSAGGNVALHQPLSWFGVMTQEKTDYHGSFTNTPTTDGFYVANFFLNQTKNSSSSYDSTIKTQNQTFHFKTKFSVSLANPMLKYWQIFMMPAKAGEAVIFNINSQHTLNLFWRPMHQ